MIRLPALKSFPGEDNEIEKVADDSKEAHCRYGIRVNDVSYDIVTSIFRASLSGFRFLLRYSCSFVVRLVTNNIRNQLIERLQGAPTKNNPLGKIHVCSRLFY